MWQEVKLKPFYFYYKREEVYYVSQSLIFSNKNSAKKSNCLIIVQNLKNYQNEKTRFTLFNTLLCCF